MISRDQGDRRLILLRALQLLSNVLSDVLTYLHTRGSAITPGVCTCTTFCMNFIQQTRTPVLVVSIRLRIFDFMLVIAFHAQAS